MDQTGTGAPPPGGKYSRYESGAYWRARRQMIYYQYIDALVRIVGRDARSMLDVGSGKAPYLEWFDWIPERVSIDPAAPYSSERVRGIKADFLSHDFGQTFDVVSCVQVLEHIKDARTFSRRLLSMGRFVIVAVPYFWFPGTPGHVHDPVSLRKLESWFGRRANWSTVVTEPLRGNRGRRLIAVFDRDNPGKRLSEQEFAIGTKGRGRVATRRTRLERIALAIRDRFF